MTQRSVLLIIIILGGLWGLGLLNPAPRVEQYPLAVASVIINAAFKDSIFHTEGKVTKDAPPFVFISVLRRVTINNSDAHTTVVASRKVALKDGAFSADFGLLDDRAWLEQVKKTFKAEAITPDGVLEAAVSPVALKTPVRRELIAASAFLAYQEK